MKKILIATTNEGKFHEFVTEYKDLNYQFINLKNIGLDKIDLEEPHEELWQNAYHKAKFFGDKSGLLTIAEDTGFFVKYLDGLPGIKAKRFADTAEERNKKVIGLLKGVPVKKRGCYFKTDACLYDPIDGGFTIFTGQVNGLIGNKIIGEAKNGLGYDCIFYYPTAKKYFSQISTLDKNRVSHRGQVIHKIKYFLSRNFDAKQLICPVAMIIEKNKILLLKRRDARHEFNNKWEFPGGGVNFGEGITQCLKREVKEETGLTIKILEQLPQILMGTRKPTQGNYQVFLVVYICQKTAGGKVKITDHESAGYRWCTLYEALKLPLLLLNRESIEKNIKFIKKYLS